MGTRRERVILDLEDHLSPGMAKAAGSTALLNRELKSLSRDSVQTRRAVSDIDRPVSDLGRSSTSTSREVDRLSGRMRILADVATILGPALVPIGAVAVPAVSGLAAQLGFAAVAAGTAVLAFQGVGDALKALNDYKLAPTTAHLQALQDKMSALGPAGRQFVRELQQLRPVLQELQNVAQAGMFPGVVEGLKAMETALPRVEAVIAAVSSEMGKIAAETGQSLASERWTPFLDFIGREAPSALADMAKAAGNTAHAVAELFMATDPLNDGFSQWLVNATASLDRWASGLSKTQGFRDFVDYIQTNGPQVAETFGAIANALVQIVQAAAPLGGPVLHGVEVLADALASIADSDLGTPLFTAAAALALFNRAVGLATAGRSGLQGFETRMSAAGAKAKGLGASVRATAADLTLLGTTAMTAGARTERELLRANTASTRLKRNLAPIGKGAGLLAGLAIASTGAADKIGLTNTASLALMGTWAAPGIGTAIGAAAGLFLDAKAAASGFADALKNVDQVAASGDLEAMSAKLADLKSQIHDATSTSSTGDFFGDQFSKIGDALSHPFDIKPGDERVTAAKAALKEIEGAMNDASGKAGSAAEATDAYGNTIAGTGRNAQTTAAQIRGMVDAMKAQRQEANAAFSAETQYRQALKDARAQADKNNAGIKGDSDAALKNREALETLATAWNNQSDAVKNNEAKFRAARSAFIETATAMGVPEAAAKRLARQLLEIPQSRVIGVTLNSQDAQGEIARIKAELAGIPREVRTRYYVTQMNAFNKPRVLPGQADGGTVPGLAFGGRVPGSRYPYRDSVLALVGGVRPLLLAGTEEVITNRHGEADRFRADRAAGRIPAYADGGTVGRAVLPGPGIDYERLGRSVAEALVGDRSAEFRTTRDAHLAALRIARLEAPSSGTPRDPLLAYGAL